MTDTIKAKFIVFIAFLAIANPEDLCPDTLVAQTHCALKVCTENETNGELEFELCMKCFPDEMRKLCDELIEKHYKQHVIAEESRLFNEIEDKTMSNAEYVVTGSTTSGTWEGTPIQIS